MITLDLSILNQKGTPMFNSDLFANRPAAGIVGRIFISTDTQTIFRDTGTTWDTIGGGGGTIAGSIATGQVAFGTAANTIGGNNNLFWDSTNNRLGILTNTPARSLSIVGTTTFGTNTPSFSANHFIQGITDITTLIVRTAEGANTNIQNWYAGNNLRASLNASGDFSSVTIRPTSTGASFPPIGFAADGQAGLYYGSGVGIVTNNTERMKIYNSTGNVVIQNGGAFTDAGFRLDVNGTGRYQDNLTISANRTTPTLLTISNTTAGVSSESRINFVSNSSSQGIISKTSSSTTPYKFVSASDFYIYNQTAGDLTIINDFATGTIKFGAGASSTAQMTLFANGNLGIGSTTQIATTIKLQVTGTAYISDTSAYSTGTIQSFVTVRNTTINTAISASSGICNYVSTGDSTIQSSQSVPASTSFAGIYSFNKYAFASAGLTLTATQAAGNGTRSVSQLQTQNVFKGTNNGTITHVSGIQIAGFYNESNTIITPVIPNAYQLIINDTGAYGHTFTFTNRWGIYQEGINDRNYLAGNLLLNSTTDTGQILQVNGAIRVNGQASGTAGGASGQHLIINVDGTQYKIALLNP